MDIGEQTAWRRASRGLAAAAVTAAALGTASPALGTASPALGTASAALGTASAAAAAAPVHCTNDYGLIQPRGEIFNLRTSEGPAKLDGYAPRCLVAAAVAASLVSDQRHFLSARPRTYDVYGARWNAGVWRCTRYFVVHHTTHFEYSDGFVTCVHMHDYGSAANTLRATVRFGYHAGV